MKNLVSTEWLEKNLNNVKILDCSWHLPNSNRNALKEFNTSHIKNSIFFDIEENSNKNTSLPHMLTNKNDWETIVSNLGIENKDHIICYDNSDVISSCRVWYNFLYFGHSPEKISVLDGGLKKWLEQKKEVTKEIKIFQSTNYHAKEDASLVLNKKQIDANIKSQSFELIDARSKERFLGLQPEARKELRSGNIKFSKNIPYTNLINKDRTFKTRNELLEIFKQNNIDPEKKLAFTCGSGITACVLGLTNSIISDKKPIIYDGSWAEYGIK